MQKDLIQPQEMDLDSTDRLPMIEGTLVDPDVEDDAVPLDTPPGTAGSTAIGSQRTAPEFPRTTGVDLPSLAQSIRSVEERIGRQRTEYEALARSHEFARDAEAASTARAGALSADLAAARTALEAEQHRSRDLEQRLSEANAAAQAARARAEEAAQQSERLGSESRTLRDSLATRDATIVQVLHSLGERDAQLTALQREHAKIVPALEARSQSSRQLEAELHSARAETAAFAAELTAGKRSLAAQAAKTTRGESELNAARLELRTAKGLAEVYLERLRTREFRRGVDQNLYRDLDGQVSAATANVETLRAEHDRLNGQLAERNAKLAAQDATIGKLNSSAAANSAALGQHASEIQRRDQSRADLTAQLAASQGEVARLNKELAARDAAVTEARATGTGEAQRAKDLLTAAEQRHTEQAAQITQLQSEVETTEQEMTVLMAHLQEARRPIQSIQADIKRLTDELAAKTKGLEQMNEENKKLRATLERTRGALEEREFLIRRLERSESNNANALGRIQTSMERLGVSAATAPAAPSEASPPTGEMRAELIRIDGDRKGTTHALVRRTRIGRATGCELHIDSSSVSRHHALILLGSREAIIEDLNSTNGVFVNGRKITRQLLNDGDTVTIGEEQFRFAVKHAPRAPEPSVPEPSVPEPSVSEPSVPEPPPGA
jgi:chromosome segregation ATPase